jgi:hypothetical protein
MPPEVVQEIDRDGWKFKFPDPDTRSRAPLVTLAIGVAGGKTGTCVRRSLHAETWLTNLAEAEMFVKLLRPAWGFARIKRLVRGGPSNHVAAIAAQLRRDGIDAPLPILIGVEASTGRELIVTARVRGTVLPRFLREHQRELGHKRAVLRALGAEIGRLHSLGYIHGDLTPFNILLSKDEPLKFVLLDHERTRRTWLARQARPRLRNFVQLGRFSLPGLTRTDRMRVWCGYVAERKSSNSELRRVVRMIHDRVTRDARKAPESPKPIVTPGEVGEI